VKLQIDIMFLGKRPKEVNTFLNEKKKVAGV
jgi:hypothetical protein